MKISKYLNIILGVLLIISLTYIINIKFSNNVKKEEIKDYILNTDNSD